MKKITLISILITLLIFEEKNLSAQPYSNLEVANLLVDSSTVIISNQIINKSEWYHFRNNSLTDYNLFENRTISGLLNNGLKIKVDSLNGKNRIKYSISQTHLFQGSIF